MAKTRAKTEFGDFQTPSALARDVCASLAALSVSPRAIVEPTCGEGNLLMAALEAFPGAEQILGIEINAAYLLRLRLKLDSAEGTEKVVLREADFFSHDWSFIRSLPEPVFVIGNPPWVTNSSLGAIQSQNLPRKANFNGHSGLDALTGKSNFDISEWMLIQTLEWLQGRSGVLAVLCKTSVARKVLAHAWKKGLNIASATLHVIDAKEYFDATVNACLLTCVFHPSRKSCHANVYDSLHDTVSASQIAICDGELIADAEAYEVARSLVADQKQAGLEWRSGIKHDCSAVMELRESDGKLINGWGETVDIEDIHLFPMFKGSEVANDMTIQPRRRMIVPQQFVGQETATITRSAPKTSDYLTAHASHLDARRSSIYLKKPRFSVFGVGPYTFSPWKVAVAGLYKKPHFRVCPSHQGKPVVFDDTVNFLPCTSAAQAELLCELLQSEPALSFFTAFIFWDAKRPITVDLLNRLDLRKLAHSCGLSAEFSRFFRNTSIDFYEKSLF
ncbi:MAG: SAM-dependent methyltransferase [Pirellulaceae bacterium]